VAQVVHQNLNFNFNDENLKYYSFFCCKWKNKSKKCFYQTLKIRNKINLLITNKQGLRTAINELKAKVTLYFLTFLKETLSFQENKITKIKNNEKVTNKIL
jgi:hypothetical protein